MKKVKCPACFGTGQVPDHQCIGASLRAVRKVSLREAAECIGISVPHLSLLERGKRRWKPELVEKYQECCK